MKKVATVTTALLLTACSNSPSSIPGQPSLLSEYPDAIVHPIGSQRIINRVKTIDNYPLAAIRNFPQETPKVGCVMLEVLVDKTGRVKRTAVSESYPRSIFNSEAQKDARMTRYQTPDKPFITYQFYQFDIDSQRDTGYITTLRDRSATEVTLEINFKRRYERFIRENDYPMGNTPTLKKMPKQCKSLYNRYAAYPDPASKTGG